MAIRSLKNGTFSRSLLIGNDAYYPGDYYSIASTSVPSGGSSTVEFTSIPSGYSHLQIRYQARFGGAITYATWLYLRFNSDSGANYRYHRLNGRGDGVVYADTNSANQVHAGYVAGNNGLSNQFAIGVIDILDYTNANKNKVVRALSGNNGQSTTTDNDLAMISSLWTSTNAITSITLLPPSSTFNQYSRFSLYGIK